MERLSVDELIVSLNRSYAASDERVRPCTRCDGDGSWVEMRGHYRTEVECWACDGSGVAWRQAA